MARFFNQYSDMVDRKRHEIAQVVAHIARNGLSGEAAASVGERLLPALRVVYGAAPGVREFPPAYFAALTRVAIENSDSPADMSAARASLGRAHAEVTSMVRAQFRSVGILDLPADDLILVVAEAGRLRAKVKEELAELRSKVGGRTSLLDRVRMRLGRSRAEELAEEAIDLNPAAVSSHASVAKMVFHAADRRMNYPGEPLERGSRTEDVAVPSPLPLLGAAAALSEYLSKDDQDRLRNWITKSGDYFPLSVDETEEQGLSFPWMARG